MKIEHIKINGTTLARHDLGFEKASTQCIAGFNHNIYPGYVQGNRFSPNARISGRARIYPADLVTLLYMQIYIWSEPFALLFLCCND